MRFARKLTVNMLCRLKSLVLYPFRVPNYLKVRWLYFLVSRKKGLQIEGSIILKGRPMIDITEGALITIRNNVTLNSMNRGYHITLHSPVKFHASINRSTPADTKKNQLQLILKAISGLIALIVHLI